MLNIYQTDDTFQPIRKMLETCGTLKLKFQMFSLCLFEKLVDRKRNIEEKL